MVGRDGARKRHTIEGRPKVKTGCKTCRIRKVKCDERKPFCQKCVTTGRTCDGYESPFRITTSQSRNGAPGSYVKSIVVSPTNQPRFMEIGSQDIKLLGRYFSTKTIFDVNLDCDAEAKQALQASLTHPHIRSAVLSLRALREDFEISEFRPNSVTLPTSSYHYGLQQYSVALGGLASELSSLSSNGVKSALICCQIFISIEQLRNDYVAVAQHIIQGLRIMREYRARPGLVDEQHLVQARQDQLPLLDVFIIKLFAAPCKFSDLHEATQSAGAQISAVWKSPQNRSAECHGRPTIAPNMRTELTKIASATLDFLSTLSQVKSAQLALGLLSTRASLLCSLESWYRRLENIQKETEYPAPEPISVIFMRLFYSILRIVLLGALDSSPNVYVDLRAEMTRFQDVAKNLAERLVAWKKSK